MSLQRLLLITPQLLLFQFSVVFCQKSVESFVLFFFSYCNFIQVNFCKTDNISRPIKCFVFQLNFFHFRTTSLRTQEEMAIFSSFDIITALTSFALTLTESAFYLSNLVFCSYISFVQFPRNRVHFFTCKFVK